jgi:FixJ family two-component response regulator
LARRVHDTHPQIPVIIVTGYGDIDSGKEANAVLQKEQMFPALLEKIKVYLGESEATPAA